MKVTLGDKVKDPLTGIEGIAFSYITYMHGCERVGIQQSKHKNEKGEWFVPDLFYVDDPQLEVVKAGFIKVKKPKGESLGGPSGFESSHKPRV